jgi:DNA-binding PadR family transcriptional regulator
MGSNGGMMPGNISPVVFQILLALADTDLHGYGIKLEVERRTDGAMNLGSGTLYEAIQRLQAAGLVAETASPPDAPTGARKRRYYRLEEAGREALEEELTRMEKIVRFARRKKLMPQAR